MATPVINNPIYQRRSWNYNNNVQYIEASAIATLQIKGGGTPLVGGLVTNTTTGATGTLLSYTFLGGSGYEFVIDCNATDESLWTPDNVLDNNGISTWNIASILDFQVNNSFDVLPEAEVIHCNTIKGPLTLNLLPLSKYWNVSYKLFIYDYGSDGTDGVSSKNPISIKPATSNKINTYGESIELSANSGCALVRPINNKNWALQRFEEKTIPINHSNLYDLILNESLIPGSFYIITDYKSANFLNGYKTAEDNPTPIDPSFNPREIYYGPNESLIFQAISKSQLSRTGYSLDYSEDIIEYEPYVNKIGFLYYIDNGTVMPDSSVVSGFNLEWDGNNVYFNMPPNYPVLYGHPLYIYAEFNGGTYYQDGTYDPVIPGITQPNFAYSSDNPYYGYPKKLSRIKVEDNGSKVIMLDLNFDDYDNCTYFSAEIVYEIGSCNGWITRRIDPQRNIDIPFDFRGRKYRRYEIDLSSVSASSGTYFYGIGDNPFLFGAYRPTTGNYQDFNLFSSDSYFIYNFKWEGPGGPTPIYRGLSDNNIFGFGDDTLEIKNTKLSGDIQRNTLSSNFNETSINSNFCDNIMWGNFYGNIIRSDFKSNLIAGAFNRNTIEYNTSLDFIQAFVNNIISFNFYGNEIRSTFNSNNIGSSFYENRIFSSSFNGFSSNTIVSNFRRNEITVSIIGTDFTASTFVYGDYDCKIFTRQGGTDVLSYVDSSNVTQYPLSINL